ncbi:MAG: DUF421 domain-containing protein [Clostridia bacterium]|nr:DUF421 domain-containing protein [Clostridia bacterium]
MEYIKILLSSVSSLAVLFILTKLMGNRQVSELTMFDYIIGISIGSIAAEMATEIEKPIYGIVAMTVYALVAVLISFITTKSMRFRRMFFGRSIIIMDKGKISKSALKKAKLDISEFLMQARTSGYFDLAEIDFAVMEPNGKISFLPNSGSKPVTSDDMELKTKDSSFCYNVIADGKILEKNLQLIGYDSNWLNKKLNDNNVKIKEILLATVDSNGKLEIFKDYS